MALVVMVAAPGSAKADVTSLPTVKPVGVNASDFTWSQYANYVNGGDFSSDPPGVSGSNFNAMLRSMNNELDSVLTAANANKRDILRFGLNAARRMWVAEPPAARPMFRQNYWNLVTGSVDPMNGDGGRPGINEWASARVQALADEADRIAIARAPYSAWGAGLTFGMGVTTVLDLLPTSITGWILLKDLYFQIQSLIPTPSTPMPIGSVTEVHVSNVPQVIPGSYVNPVSGQPDSPSDYMYPATVRFEITASDGTTSWQTQSTTAIDTTQCNAIAADHNTGDPSHVPTSHMQTQYCYDSGLAATNANIQAAMAGIQGVQQFGPFYPAVSGIDYDPSGGELKRYSYGIPVDAIQGAVTPTYDPPGGGAYVTTFPGSAIPDTVPDDWSTPRPDEGLNSAFDNVADPVWYPDPNQTGTAPAPEPGPPGPVYVTVPFWDYGGLPADFITRAHDLGFTTTTVVATPQEADSSVPENTMVNTSPSTGTQIQVNPGDPAPNIVISLNPPAPAPPPYPDPGTTSEGDPIPPTPPPAATCLGIVRPPFNFHPLENTGIGQSFPFGLIAWVDQSFQDWYGQTTAPHFTIDYAVGTGYHAPLNVDLAMFDPMMPMLRLVFLISSSLGLIYWAAGFVTTPKDEQMTLF